MDGDEPEVLDDDARERTLAAVLEQHPHALVSGLDGDGRVVDLPSSIRHVTPAPGLHTALDLVEAGSRAIAYDVSNRAKTLGSASAPIVLVGGVRATCWVVDMRHRHGVLVAVVAAASGAELPTNRPESPTIIPRSGRIDKDEVAIIRFADDRLCRILGYSTEELVGTRSLDLVHPDDREASISAWLEVLDAPGGSVRSRARHRHRGGSWLWMEVTNTNLLDEPEALVVAEMVDISEEMAALEALRQREQLLSRLAEALPSGILHVDQLSNVVYSNARLHVVLGIGRAATFDEQFAAAIAADRLRLGAALDEVLVGGVDADVEVRLVLAGSPMPHLCAVAIRALTDAAGVPDGAVLCIDDVTEAAALRAELERRANVDQLTGCLNRAAVLARLDRILSRHGTVNSGTAVAFFDLDGFKAVNDTFGHEAGDRLLAGAAQRLREAMRAPDLIGRLGGDEFIVVLPEIPSVDEAMRVVARFRAALDEPFVVRDGLELRVRSSIGVAWTKDLDTTADAIIAAADRGMYQSKRDGMAEPVLVRL